MRGLKGQLAEAQVVSFCVKAAAAAVSDTVQHLKQHYTFGLQSASHLVVAWGRGDESM
jgi:hypothetical protein